MITEYTQITFSRKQTCWEHCFLHELPLSNFPFRTSLSNFPFRTSPFELSLSNFPFRTFPFELLLSSFSFRTSPFELPLLINRKVLQRVLPKLPSSISNMESVSIQTYLHSQRSSLSSSYNSKRASRLIRSSTCGFQLSHDLPLNCVLVLWRSGCCMAHDKM